MGSYQPTAEEQLTFLNNIQRLLSEGDFVATYKFALLSALADLSVENEPKADGTLTLSIREIAEKFISYYWPQAAPYLPIGTDATPTILQQNSSGQAKVLNLLNEYQNIHTPKLAQAKNDSRHWNSLVSSVASVVVTMPLWRLQTVGDVAIPLVFLYENTAGTVSEITLFPGVAWNFRHFHGLITNLVQSAWILQLHRIKRNQPLLGKSSDLKEFLFGSERSNLDIYRPLLTDLQDKSCFYCNKPIKDKGEIDHFIPWSRYPIDLGHNFVLAHKGCNGSKSDYLASPHHLEQWMERNSIHEAILKNEFSLLAIEHDLDSSNQITHWAYEQTESSGGLVWAKKKSLQPLDTSWRSLFQ